MEKINHIIVEVPDKMSDFASEDVMSELKSDGLNIIVQRKPQQGAMATLEWAIPTALVVYICKPYFEGFLSEAGKDHYNILRNWLKRFIKSGRSIRVHTFYASESSNKKPDNNTQSKSVSVLLQTKSGKVIKVLFDEELTVEDWDDAIDQLLDFAIDNQNNFPNDYLTKQLERYDSDNRLQVYAVIDKKEKNLVFYGDRDLIALQMKGRRNETLDKRNLGNS